MNKYGFVLISLLFLSFSAKAQYLIRDHVSIGVGPSMFYADNGGVYNDFQLKVRPVVSLTYNREISDFWDIRLTVGNQWVESADNGSLHSSWVRNWQANNQAVGFSGMVAFADVMPVYQLNPNFPGRVGNVINYYAGLGVGYLYSMRVDEFLVDIPADPRPEAGVYREEENHNGAVYIPLRVGVSTNFESEWDLAFEFTGMVSMDTGIDGNEVQNKQLSPDMLLQLKVMVKRYIGRNR